VFIVKTRPKRSPNHILTNLVHTFFCENVAKNYGYWYDFQVKLPKVTNRPNSENAPNLVTLKGTRVKVLSETTVQEIKKTNELHEDIGTRVIVIKSPIKLSN
jgi:hypothetical protein